MQDAITESLSFPAGSVAGGVAAVGSASLGSIGPAADPLTEVLRRGARDLLVAAVEAEAAQWLARRAAIVDAHGHRQVVRNGHAAPRTVVTGVGSLTIEMPRVHDRRPPSEKERFTSALLPPYLRKAKSIEELIPYLYLKGVSTGDFTEALQALLGP
jgi:transposase-like protein